MTQIWYPPANLKDKAPPTGPYITGYKPRGLLHITAGSSYAGALSVYNTKGYWPHFTATFERRTFDIYQHLPINQYAKALKNAAGGVETNRASCIQIEIVWPSITTVGQMAKPYLDGIAAWMRWVEANAGIQRATAVEWKINPPRMSSAKWTSYNGWCGHMHTPENDHDDPGPIDIAYLLAVPSPIPEVPVRLVKKAGHAAVFLSLGGLLIHIPSAELLAAHYAGKPVEELAETDLVWGQPVFGYSGAHIDA